MSIAAVIALITAISKAIPVLDKWFEALAAAYVVQRKLWVNKENHKAIEQAVKAQDQRGIEDADHSGKPSGVGEIRTSLPGVRK